MVGMLRDLALASTALPLTASRLAMISTRTPLLIMSSPMLTNASRLPSAFLISTGTPAASNAAFRYFGSSVTQRCALFVSGRITPTRACRDSPLLPSDGPAVSHAVTPAAASIPTVANASSLVRIS
jgi:hypothetical protein